jgi:large subunit ribosomal protein L9
MEVILTRDVDALGGKNEVVRVKDGFARNYLFPTKAAIPATAGNLRALREKIRLANEAKASRIDAARELAEKLSKLHIDFTMKAGKEGKLFGSVTSQEISDRIRELSGLELDKRRINVPAHLKTTGQYTVQVRLEVGVGATLHLDIKSDEPVQPAEEADVEAMPGSEARPAARGRRAREAAAGEPGATPGAGDELAAGTGEHGGGAAEARSRKPMRRSESEAELPEDTERSRQQPQQKKKRRSVNEAEMDLPE